MKLNEINSMIDFWGILGFFCHSKHLVHPIYKTLPVIHINHITCGKIKETQTRTETIKTKKNLNELHSKQI